MMLPIAILALWVVGWLLLFHIPLCVRRTNSALPPVSVIVPARNEEANLPTLLKSLAGQMVAPSEILVVDDASTDRTAAVAREYGARVLASDPLPEGWRGKPWACHQGALAARHDLLCFVDADTRFEPDGLARALETWPEERGALSLAAWHDTPTWPEQMSAFFNLMMVVGIGAFTVLGKRLHPAGLFGPFLLVSRHAYQAAGGHAAVREHILENVYMAKHFRAADIPIACRGGRGVLSIRMYPGGLRELAAGWAKAFTSGAANTPAYLMAPAVAWITGAMLAWILPVVAVAAPGLTGPFWPSIFLLYGLQMAVLLRRLGRFHLVTALLYPIPLCFYFVVFFGALARKRRGDAVTWKGRSIPADKPQGM